MVNWIKALSTGLGFPHQRQTVRFLQGESWTQARMPTVPYFFILIADSISKYLNQGISLGQSTGVKLAPNVQAINHGQYADDIILMGEASESEARFFRL